MSLTPIFAWNEKCLCRNFEDYWYRCPEETSYLIIMLNCFYFQTRCCFHQILSFDQSFHSPISCLLIFLITSSNNICFTFNSRNFRFTHLNQKMACFDFINHHASIRMEITILEFDSFRNSIQMYILHQRYVL